MTAEMHVQQSRVPEHSFTRQLRSESSVRARLRQTLCFSTLLELYDNC